MNENLEELYKITVRCLRSRLISEYQKMINNKKFENSEIIINNNQKNIIGKSKKIIFTIFLKEQNENEEKKSEYSFIIDDNYPFRKPEIFYNKNPYSSLLKLPQRLMLEYKIITDKSCLCCESLNCVDNWSTLVGLENIISDIDKTKKIKRSIYIRLLCKSIIEKYLIDDIYFDIISFLY